ncbi:EAL domain-containing protein [Blastococcus deserti]|uniref:EAL domain-containing protein n=1 Tax=Blastococcus deserti TaxID=2259033 RepID=A0ABW4XFP9_9ACTN
MPHPAGEQTLGDVAQPARAVRPDTLVRAVEELLRADGDAQWLVMTDAGGPVLLTRTWLQQLRSGSSGREDDARRPVREVSPPGAVVVPAACTVGEAAALVAERRRTGEQIPEALVVSRPDGAFGVVPLTTLFEHLAQHYAHRAVHDPLTGLPNRLFVEEQLQPPRSFRPAVLFFIDLDRFKDVNDQFGHAAGDEVLLQLAARLRALGRAEDLVARLSGDEFALITADRLTFEQAEAVANRILLAADTPLVLRGTDGAENLVTVGASVGIAHAPAGDGFFGAEALNVLLAQADAAMYRAKSLGRGRAAHFAPELLEDREATEAVRARHVLERRLRAAVDGGGLTLRYQPVVALPSGQVTGVEALARWHDEELGEISPDEFVPLAERTGLIVDLGRWVLRTACHEAARWPVVVAGPAASVAVNVSPVQLGQRDFVGDVVAALRASGLEPPRLCLEITETAAITDLASTAARLEELRRLGVRLALDDFGSGHSSLTLLRRLPVDLVKIDRSFVERVTTDTADAVLVRLVIEAAHSLGRRVCAEGVETLEQARQLVAMGCDSAQGWLFGRPADVPVLAGPTQGPAGMHVAAPAPLPLHGSDETVVVTTPDGIITYASATTGPVLGWLPQELVGRSVLDLLHPDDVERLRSAGRLGGAGGADGTVHRALHRDAGVRWLRTTMQELTDSTGSVREVLTVSRDVTATVAAQEALAESESMFRHAFDDAPIGMALTGLDGRFIRVNKAYAALVDRVPEQLAEMSVADLTHPDDLAQDDANLAQARTGAAQAHDVRKRYLRADGTPVHVRVHAAAVLDRSGRPAYVFAHILQREPHDDGRGRSRRG